PPRPSTRFPYTTLFRSGRANLSTEQQALLTGKAQWISAVAETGFPVIPTICITRAAWEGLQAERRQRDDRLRKHWVATLFRLVGDRKSTRLNSSHQIIS